MTDTKPTYRSPANVLPSPAPSDEPSPSFSNPKDSPNPRDLFIAAASPLSQNAGDVTASVSDALAPDASSRWIPNSGPTVAGTETAIPATSAEQTSLALGVQSSRTMPPPSVPQSNQIGILSQVPSVSRLATGQQRSPDLQSRPGSAGEQLHKRRRVDHVEPNDPELIRQHQTGHNGTVGVAPSRRDDTFTALASQIDQRVQSVGGEQGLLQQVERPRFTLLKDACAHRDVFYLYLHAIFCRWSLDQSSFPSLPSYNLDAISKGFAILETVLKKNTGFSEENLVWCASFLSFNFTDPTSGAINEGVKQVADFLTALSQHWPSLHQAVFHRNYPFLMDELLGKLQCYSTVMQNILFTASRRRIGVPDGDLGAQVHMYFDQDQRQHCDGHGQFQRVTLSGDPIEVENRNWFLIQKYREIVSKAKAEQERLQQQAQQSQQQAQQQDLQRQRIMHRQRSMQAAQAQHFQHFQQSQMQSVGQQLPFPLQPLPSNCQPNFSSVEAYPDRNAHWVRNQMQNQMQNPHATQARRVSMTPTSPVTHQGAQFAARPPSSGPYSGIGSPVIPQHAFSPHTAARQLNHLPQHASLSNSPTAQAVLSTQNYATILPSSQQYFTDFQPQANGMQDQLRSWQSAPPGQFPAQWSADMRSTAMTRSPHMPMQQINPSGSPGLGLPQQSRMPQSRIPMHQQMERRNGSAITYNSVARPMSRNLVIPPPGHVIDRSEYPHGHQDKKALIMSLHQCQARSPDRTRRAGDADERFYQYVHSFAVVPFRLSQYHELELEVSSQQFERLCKKKGLTSLGDTQAPPVRQYANGSLRFRVRCCRLQSERQAAESLWVTRELMWPDHIFIHFNNQKLVIRRGSHNGKDLPVELTDFVVPGKNKLKVALSKPPTAFDRKDNFFYLAVEIIEAASHSGILKNIETTGRIDRDETLKKIRSRVTVAPDDDGIAIIDRTGVIARELSIDLTDPFSAKIFTIPARGATCTHMECFDLETWLTTRPIKQQIKCGHRDDALCTCPKRSEPSEPDKWKCPICFADARPGSLRIDSFLEDVRKQLEESNQLDTKSILVAEDGTWRPVEEPDDDDAGSDGDGPATHRDAAALQKSKSSSKSASLERVPVEVIELD